MSETARVFCIVIMLNTLFIIVMHLLLKAWEQFIEMIFADHNKQVEFILSERLDEGYTSAYVDCLTESYIREWIHSKSSDVKCGDSVFAYLIQDETYLELLKCPKRGVFQQKKDKKENHIVNLAVRNHSSYDFVRIHSITCRTISPELVQLEHKGMWFSYDIPLVN